MNPSKTVLPKMPLKLQKELMSSKMMRMIDANDADADAACLPLTMTVEYAVDGYDDDASSRFSQPVVDVDVDDVYLRSLTPFLPNQEMKPNCDP